MGYRVKEYREKKKMTQEELAAKSGISRGTICAIESGRERNTTSKTLLAIAKALDTTVDVLFLIKVFD